MVGLSPLVVACCGGGDGTRKVWPAEEAHRQHPEAAGGHQSTARQDGGRVQQPDAGHSECLHSYFNTVQWKYSMSCTLLWLLYTEHRLNWTSCCRTKSIRTKCKCYTYALVTFSVMKQGCISIACLSSMTFCFKSSAVMVEQQDQFQNQITRNYQKKLSLQFIVILQSSAVL